MWIGSVGMRVAGVSIRATMMSLLSARRIEWRLGSELINPRRRSWVHARIIGPERDSLIIVWVILGDEGLRTALASEYAPYGALVTFDL